MTSRKPGSSSGKRWSPHAKDKIRALYPTYPQADIMKALPGRTWSAIVRQATALGVRRKAPLLRECRSQTRHPLAAQLRAERIQKRLSLRALGEIAGYSGEHIGEWERGTYSPGMPSFVNWANSLGFELTLTRRAR